MPPDAMTGVAGGAGDRPVELQVGSAERAVLPHVGDHVPGAADVVEEGQGLPQVTTGAGPATRRGSYRVVPSASSTPRTSRPTAIRRPCTAIARAHHAGSSSAVVARTTRAQSVDTAHSSEWSSRMPPANSTATSRFPITDASSSALEPRANAASRSTRWIHSARRPATRGRPHVRRRGRCTPCRGRPGAIARLARRRRRPPAGARRARLDSRGTSAAVAIDRRARRGAPREGRHVVTGRGGPSAPRPTRTGTCRR